MGRAAYLRFSQKSAEKRPASLRSSGQAEGRRHPATARGAAVCCATTSSKLLLITACLLCGVGCNNTCISGSWNPGAGSTVTGKVSSPPPSCSLSAANGILRVEIGATAETTATPASGWAGPRVAHLFVTVAGLELHSSALASDDALGWQPLAPEPLIHPVQVDLLADAHSNSSSAPFGDALLPAGMYRQIRLRLASQPPTESALETSRCGRAPHCAVLSDGQVRPLVFPPSRPHLRMVFEDLPGRGLYVPPDSMVTLVLEFDRDRSWVWRSGDSLVFNPVFRPNVQRPPEAD